MNIIVTGASRGIGFETALSLVQQGHHVIAFARNGKGLENLQNAARSSGADTRLMILAGDLTSEKDIQQLVFTARSLNSRIDILINNAGAIINKPFEKISPEELRNVYEVNVFVPFRLTQALLPLMGGETCSHIVNISSMGGFQGSAKFPGLSAYSSSKAALAGLSEVMAEEFKGKNIKVNCLALGAAQTEMLEKAFPGYKASVSAREMANWIVWFALNGHLFFNGKILPVSLSTP
ncbi:MAG TPA: SDR family oxidoreductase [Bacteroidia bacterium]|nr:SDR family oxidoreductase [Bacteroidia bacterium]